MGGGTILIPLITLILGVQQKTAQGINLLSFIPMAILSLIVHIKNKLVVFRVGVVIIITGTISALISSFIANNMSSDILRKIFGVFLLVVGIYQAVCTIILLFKKGSTNTPKDIQYKIHLWYK